MSKFEVEMKTTKCLKSKVPCQSDCSDKSVEPSFLSWNTNYTSKFFIIFLSQIQGTIIRNVVGIIDEWKKNIVKL